MTGGANYPATAGRSDFRDLRCPATPERCLAGTAKGGCAIATTAGATRDNARQALTEPCLENPWVKETNHG